MARLIQSVSYMWEGSVFGEAGLGSSKTRDEATFGGGKSYYGSGLPGKAARSLTALAGDPWLSQSKPVSGLGRALEAGRRARFRSSRRQLPEEFFHG